MNLRRIAIAGGHGETQEFCTDRDVQEMEAEFMFLTNLVSIFARPGNVEGATVAGKDALDTAQLWVADRMRARQDMAQSMTLSLKYAMPDSVAIVMDKLFMGTALTMDVNQAENIGIMLIKTAAYMQALLNVQDQAQALSEKEKLQTKPQ